MRNFSFEAMTTVVASISGVATLLVIYSGWLLGRHSRRQRQTFRANSVTVRHVRNDDFLLSLIATYEPEVKSLLDPPPDEVIVAVNTLTNKDIPRGTVIVKVAGQSRGVILALPGESPVRPLFEAILKVSLDVSPKPKPTPTLVAETQVA